MEQAIIMHIDPRIDDNYHVWYKTTVFPDTELCVCAKEAHIRDVKLLKDLIKSDVLEHIEKRKKENDIVNLIDFIKSTPLMFSLH